MCTRTVLVGVLAGMLGGCAAASKTDRTVTQADAEPIPSPTSAEAEHDAEAKEKEKSEAQTKAEKEAKRAKLTRDLEIARQKITQAQLALEHQKADDDSSVQKTAAARDLAAAKLEDFEKRTAPMKLEKARFALKRTEDGVLESREELEQLEMMYSEEELGDKTREIVIERAKRRLGRAERGLEIQLTELQNLEKETIPLERLELQLKTEAGAAEHQSKERSAEANLLEKRISLMSAQAEVARIETELKNLDVE